MTSNYRKQHFPFPSPPASTPECDLKITKLNFFSLTQYISDFLPLAPLHVPHLRGCKVLTDFFEISFRERFCTTHLSRVIKTTLLPYIM